MEKTKVCCVFNYNPLYRLPIYSRMAKELDCDFFFGDTVFQKIRSFDADELPGFQGFIKARRTKFKGFIWHSGIKRIFSRKYSHYIITGDSYAFVNWILLLYAVLTRKKVFLWTHGLHAPVTGRIHRLFERLFYTIPSGIFLYGEYALPYMKEIGCKEERLYVIHNSLDTDVIDTIYSRTVESSIYRDYFGNNNPVLLYIGRIQKRKRLDLLLQAMTLLKRRGVETNLVVIGNPEDDNSLPAQVDSLHLRKVVWFYGACYEESKNAELIYNADVCVCPSEIGLTCIHVLSYGLPVVTNDDYYNQMPEYEAIISGETGSFFKVGDAEDLAQHIIKWISLDSQEREILRTKAREHIHEEWSVDYQISIIKKALKY